MNEYIVNLTKINLRGETYYRTHCYSSGQAVRFKSIIQAEEYGNDQLNKAYSKTSSNVIWFDVVKI
jgi:hypothetical protein